MEGSDSGACEASARNRAITVRANTTLPAHAITQLSPSSTTFWFSPKMDQSDPAGKTLVTAPAREISGAEPDRSGPEISRSPKTTGYVSSPAAAMSVMRIPRSRGWVPQFAGIVPNRLRFGTLRYRCASVDAIGGTQAFTLGMRCPLALAALRLHAAVQRELRTRAAGLARVGRGARGMLLRHARWGRGEGGRLRDRSRSGGSCGRQRRVV